MSIKQLAEKPIVYNYEDYRIFLRDLFSFYKENTRRFSLRKLAKMTGFSSANTIRMVINGKRNLSRPGIEKVATGFSMPEYEMAFFENLVLFNQSKKDQDRQRYAHKLLRSKEISRVKILSRYQYAFYSNWYYPVIRELVGQAEFQPDPNWMASQLVPRIEPHEAEEAFKCLWELGLIRREPNGKFVQTNSSISTDPKIQSKLLGKHQREMIAKGSKSIELFQSEEREVSGMTLLISDETFSEVKKCVHEFQMKVLRMAEADNIANRVYQLNFQLFPLTQRKTGSES